MESQARLFDPKPAVLISRCLLGVPCRYHGELHRRGKRIGRPSLVARLSRKYRLVDVCPEVDAGMPTPRPPTRIVEGRWLCDGEDVTDTFRRGAEIALQHAQQHDCQRAYLVKRSPACDPASGMCGMLLRKHGIKTVSV